MDYFQFTLSRETDVLLRGGPPVTDTVGELLDSGSNSLAANDDGFVLDRSLQFLIRRKLAAGTYYVKVKAFSVETTGLYSFHVDTVTEPGSSTADALLLDFGELGAGRIDPSTDADYFKIELSEATHVLRAGRQQHGRHRRRAARRHGRGGRGEHLRAGLQG